ncbi:Ribonuclease H-like domain,3'-5' exonuclease domain [Cinara cedri]|uniref:3'-5' exonuclease n=1 Tax=Cinara cedri TaxID=506608 RepID=A0A5E4MLB8_9HEMI|nr:Ribonuclease H-like domain,3'-5' exonuclease domain [Cinara cedri]
MSNETRYLPAWMTDSYCKQVQKPEEFIKFNGHIKTCTFSNELASYAEEILAKIDSSKCSEIVYGFDMEWPVTFNGKSRKTALIQICTDHSTCYLFHVFYIIKLPSIFVQLINHPKVRWSGVHIKNDFTKLSKNFNIDVSGALRNIIDLSAYANKVLNFDPCTCWSMATLVQKLLKKNVNKDNNIRLGHWERTNLDYNQCLYAATDAYVSINLFEY